jgi:XTP/dITP diphosphohydrolase
MQSILLSTTNPSKAEQIKAVFAPLRISVQTLSEAGITGEAVEDGETLLDNALKKALYAHGAVKFSTWAMADDTGLFIRALNGQPGVRSARWAGDDATTEQITAHTLRMMEGKTDRFATFETAVALVSPAGAHHFFRGQVNGRLLETPSGKPQPKMPYSHIFVPDGSELTWAEMTVEAENRISHRGKAFRQVYDFLVNMVL